MPSQPTNPPRPTRQARAALTLAEVLIAMGVLTIGLLGVASVFPVGGHYMQSGDVADRGGAIAQAALEDAIVQGYLDPENWIVQEFQTNNCRFMDFVSGDAPAPTDPTGVRLGLRSSLNPGSLPTNIFGTAKPVPQSSRATLFGGVFVIDPIGVASGMSGSDVTGAVMRNPIYSAPVRRFPAFASGSLTNNPLWDAWQAGGAFWPVRRITVVGSKLLMNSNNDARQYEQSLQLARALFSSDDDLSLTLPDNGDTSARQLWSTALVGSQSIASKRLSNRDISWIITVAPESSSDVDTMAIQPDAHPVEVSTVVFYKRPVGRGIVSALETERLVNARVVSTGPGGGELLLERRPAGSSGGPASPFSMEPTTSPFEDLRAGQYLMVTGPHPLSTVTNPRMVLRWCRVLSVENEGRVRVNGSQVQLGVDESVSPASDRVLVALRGPDWPWSPATNLTDLTQLSNDLRVGILPGAVAVHTKTMRLETGSEWSID